jgi:hypothetical protein
MTGQTNDAEVRRALSDLVHAARGMLRASSPQANGEAHYELARAVIGAIAVLDGEERPTTQPRQRARG